MSEANPPLRIEPLDEHNQKLLDNVHPGDWQNPEPAPRYHLVVIGAGTAGLISAAGAAGLGARVALIESHFMGGDCLNVGCVPSKGLIAAARIWHTTYNENGFGDRAANEPGDFGAAMERMRRLRARVSDVDSARRFRDLGIDVFLGRGRFSAPDTVEVDGRQLRFRRAVIATGARAAAPPVPGLDQVDYLTNETVFSLPELPRRLAVIGGGPIGCELSQSFARFGSEVTLLDMADRVLVREDGDAAELVQSAMQRDGVNLELGVKILGVTQCNGESVISFERGGQHSGEPTRLASDQLLVAVGRAPNVDGLGLEAAGVDYDRQGVKVDDHLRTTNKHIYAAGDIAPLHKFTHLADAHARIVIQNALFFPRAKHTDLVIPWCTYTSPEIAHLGLYEKDAIALGHEVVTLTVPFADVDRAILDGEEEGFLRLIVQQGSDKILGATLVAAHAGDMLGELCLAVTHRIGLDQIASTIHPYPTQGEVLKKAADAWRRTKLTPGVKRMFSLWFKLLS